MGVLQGGSKDVTACDGKKNSGLGPFKSLRRRALAGWHGGGSRPALPGLHDVLCHSRSSGSFGLRVADVEPSAKTVGVEG